MKPYQKSGDSPDRRCSILAAAITTCFAIVSAPQGAMADDARATYGDIGETYGAVPGFFRLFPRDNVAEAWGAFTALQLNPDIDMDAKSRELIGVAVAAQGPCRPCVYFHAAAALANGATEAEIGAVIGIGTATRRLHTALGEAGADAETFKRETDLVLWGDARSIELRGPSSDFCRATSACEDVSALRKSGLP